MKVYLLVVVFSLVSISCSFAATDCLECIATVINDKVTTGKGCEDPYDKANNDKFKVNCTNGCMKERTEMSVLGVSTVTYKRSCASKAMTAKCSTEDKDVLTVTNKITTCYCSGSYCNNAQKMALASAGYFIAAFFLLKSVV